MQHPIINNNYQGAPNVPKEVVPGVDMRLKGVLLCEPVYFKIPAIENPFMNPDDQPDADIAMRQHYGLANLYERLGMNVYRIEPRPYLWDAVFAANYAWGRKGNFILSNYRMPIRHPEKPHFRTWLANNGFSRDHIFELPDDTDNYISFEGQAEIKTLCDEDGFLFTYGFRSSISALPQLQAFINYFMRQEGRREADVTPLELIDPRFYHGDTCILSLRTKKAVMYYPGSLSLESQERLKEALKHTGLYEVSERLAILFFCNSVYIDNYFILNVPFHPQNDEFYSLGMQGVPMKKGDARYQFLIERCLDYEGALDHVWSLGMDIIPWYTSEFYKSGGGLLCVTMFID